LQGSIGYPDLKHRVFVYGTLRSGQANHYLLSTSVFLGEYRTLARYSMRDLGAYPGVVAGRTAIVGEVYADGAASPAVIGANMPPLGYAARARFFQMAVRHDALKWRMALLP
ncbi:unnamed protein product, partial [Cyprideis torosa]